MSRIGRARSEKLLELRLGSCCLIPASDALATFIEEGADRLNDVP